LKRQVEDRKNKTFLAYNQRFIFNHSVLFFLKSLFFLFVFVREIATFFKNLRGLLLDSISRQTETLTSLPVDRITKRLEIEKGIRGDQTTLSAVDRDLASTEVGAGDFKNAIFSFSLWIRVASMLLSAYLVHSFFLALRRALAGES
jgi:hypothetical protein